MCICFAGSKNLHLANFFLLKHKIVRTMTIPPHCEPAAYKASEGILQQGMEVWEHSGAPLTTVAGEGPPLS